MTYSVWTALRFALFVLILAERLDLTVASRSCTIDNVLVEGSVDTAGVSTTEVNVHALGHCHNKDTVATILKKANPKGWEVCSHVCSVRHSQVKIWRAV